MEGSPNSSEDPKIKTILKGYNESLGTGNKLEGKEIVKESIKAEQIAKETITNANLTNEAKPFDWYTPTIIGTEQTRENVAFGTLTTPDEITSLSVPSNAILCIGFAARWKSSVSGAGRAALFIGATQLKSASSAAVLETSTSGTGFNTLTTSAGGLSATPSSSELPTTGAPIAIQATEGGLCYIFGATGAAKVSLQFRATSGSVSVVERKLWVAVMGV